MVLCVFIFKITCLEVSCEEKVSGTGKASCQSTVMPSNLDLIMIVKASAQRTYPVVYHPLQDASACQFIQHKDDGFKQIALYICLCIYLCLEFTGEQYHTM